MKDRSARVMLLWKRYALAGLLFFTYSLLTLYIVSVEKDCQLNDDLPPECPAETKDEASSREEKQPLTSDDDEQDEDVNKHVFEREKKTHTELLDSNRVPNNLLLIWCGRRWFEFNHYLSVKSAINTFKPDNVWFVYNTEPVFDFWMYNTWYRELKEEYPFFSPIHVDDTVAELKACRGFEEPNWDYIYDSLTRFGGMYLAEDVIIDEFPISLRTNDFVYALEDASKFAFILAKRGLPVKELAANPFNRKYKVRKLSCISWKSYKKGTSSSNTCVNVPDRIFPKDIWAAKTGFGRLARRHFYGTEEILRPKPNPESLVPNIAHIVWIGGGQMDFLFFLGVVSLVYVAKVDMVYIHGDAPPSGFYWETLKNHPKVKTVFRLQPQSVFGYKVQILSHVTDIWRVDFMVNYGGIYIDTDVVFVRPLDDEIRQYDAVATYDWTYWNDPFPDTINFGVSMGKKNAKFWRKFQESMKWFVDSDWSWNGLRQPYRIQERHPDLIWVNPHFSVICFQFKCHPTWLANYHNESYHHENGNNFTNWRTDVYAIHWTMPTPPELENEAALLKSNSLFSEIGTYILRTANILQDDNRTLVYPNGHKYRIK